jgi:hypothetical protein
VSLLMSPEVFCIEVCEAKWIHCTLGGLGRGWLWIDVPSSSLEGNFMEICLKCPGRDIYVKKIISPKVTPLFFWRHNEQKSYFMRVAFIKGKILAKHLFFIDRRYLKLRPRSFKVLNGSKHHFINLYWMQYCM